MSCDVMSRAPRLLPSQGITVNREEMLEEFLLSQHRKKEKRFLNVRRRLQHRLIDYFFFSLLSLTRSHRNDDGMTKAAERGRRKKSWL